MNNGKELEGLVAFIEETLLPKGFEVKTNSRIYDDDGDQIAEFDIEVKGTIGTTDLSWLIECRDRPSQGAAPISWIEQLYSRRERFNFNKVTAVSTTGFAQPAKKYAKEKGIELKEFKDFSLEYFADWIATPHLESETHIHNLKDVKLIVDKELPEEKQTALLEFMQGKRSDEAFLQSSTTGKTIACTEAFIGAVKSSNLFEDVLPSQPPKLINICAKYSESDYFTVNTNAGLIRISEIIFSGELSIEKKQIPIETSQYSHSDSGKVISDLAACHFSALGKKMSIEMHRIKQTGETHVLLRTHK